MGFEHGIFSLGFGVVLLVVFFRWVFFGFFGDGGFES